MLFFASILAGFLGALLGLGGGIIVVPVLTLFLGIDIRFAIAASLISIVATSSGAAASFLKDHLTNLRLAVFLEVATVCGAITGFLLAKRINPSALFILFAIFLSFSALMMLRKKEDQRALLDHPWSSKLKLAGSYKEKNKELIHYNIANVPVGLFIMYIAGILSALLGIGSGIFKVLAMDGAMKIPIKVSSATSNFMIGVTAAGSAGAYFLSGDIKPVIAVPVSIGIVVGAFFGAKVMPLIPAKKIRQIFVIVLLITAAQMFFKGFK